MKTAIAKPLSAVIIIISLIVLFLSRDEIDGVAASISAFMFLVGTIVLLATTVIDMLEGGGE